MTNTLEKNYDSANVKIHEYPAQVQSFMLIKIFFLQTVLIVTFVTITAFPEKSPPCKTLPALMSEKS